MTGVDLWFLATTDPQLLGIAALITALGGIMLPVVVPIATKKTRELETKVAELTKKVDECEKERRDDRDEFLALLKRGRR